MSTVKERYQRLRAEIGDLARSLDDDSLGRYVDREGPGARREFQALSRDDVRRMLAEAYSLLDTQELGDVEYAQVSDWCDDLCRYVGVWTSGELKAFFAEGSGS